MLSSRCPSWMQTLLRSSFRHSPLAVVPMYTLLFLVCFTLDFPFSYAGLASVIFQDLLASREVEMALTLCECSGVRLVVRSRLTQMERSRRFMRSVQSQSSMLAMTLAIFSPQYSSTRMMRSLMTASRMSQLSLSQHSLLGSRVAVSSSSIPRVKTLLFSSMSSSTISSYPQRRAMMSSGDGRVSVFCLSLKQVSSSMSSLGRSLKLPLSQQTCSGAMSLQVILRYCRLARVKVSASMRCSMSSRVKSLLVCSRSSSSCLRVVSTCQRKSISCSVQISMEFLKGVVCSLSSPSQSGLGRAWSIREALQVAGIVVGLRVEGGTLLLSGLLSYWPIQRIYNKGERAENQLAEG